VRNCRLSSSIDVRASVPDMRRPEAVLRFVALPARAILPVPPSSRYPWLASNSPPETETRLGNNEMLLLELSPMVRPARLLIGFATLVLLLTSSVPTFAQNPAVTISVDATALRHAIDARVYGVAHATTAQLSDLNVALN